MRNARAIFRFLHDAARRGERTALVTLTDVIGSSSRAPGTHMAVSETGAYLGSFSGGCVEAAVVAEALDVLKRGAAELVRFGVGSRYIDIRLPCGGGIDLLFTPDPPLALVEQILTRLENRVPVTLALNHDGRCGLEAGPKGGWSDQIFRVTHEPDLRLVIVGHGAEVVSLARLAGTYAGTVCVLSPDKATLAAVQPHAAELEHLLTPRTTEALHADPFSAIVFLFHDHDWEPALLQAALSTQAFFIGAMGSRKTHARRLALLTELGVSATDAVRVIGPVGLIPATRDPDTLALSVLAQIAKHQTARSVDDYIPPNTTISMNAPHDSMHS